MARKINDDVYKDVWQWQEGEYTVTRNTQWSGPGCHNGCGVLHYTKDNKLVKIEGDPKNPVYGGRLCMRCLAVPEAVNHETRILHPLKRAGERGENKWEQITWDEAYDIIEAKVREIWDEYGSGKGIATLTGTGRNTSWQANALGNLVFRTPNVCFGFLSGDSCYVPRLMAMAVIAGASSILDASQMFEKRYDDPRYTKPEVVIIWGNNPIISNPDGFMGHWIVDLMKMGTELIVIDPRCTWMAAKAKYWLRLRPGTDAAVALGFLNVIINEDLYDHDFVENWTYGFDKLKERVQEYPPSKVAEITGIPEQKLIAAARLYATAKPAAIQWGLALDQAKDGFGATHGVQCLWAITGNMDVPGGNIVVNTGYVQADIRRAMMKNMDPKDYEGRIGDDQVAIRGIGLNAQCSPDYLLEAIETGKPYPIKMLYVQATNTFANMAADAKRVYNAMKSVDFVVCSDLVLTPTAVACADIFLPVAMSCERNSIRGWWAPIRTLSKLTSAGEAKSDEQIVIDLGKRLRPESFTEWDNDVDLLNSVMNDLQSVDLGRKFSFEELQKEVYVYADFQYKKYEKGLLRKDGEKGFNTPTGYVELYSTVLDNLGYDPLPYFAEPTPGPVTTPDLMKEYPFVLTTGFRSWEFFHSEHRNLKSMREFHPWPLVEINPEAAAELGIAEGDWVIIENQRGKCRQKAKFNPSLAKNVVAAEHGWWFPEKDPAYPSLYGVFESNINNLTPMCDMGPTTYGAPYSTQICKVYKE